MSAPDRAAIDVLLADVVTALWGAGFDGAPAALAKCKHDVARAEVLFAIATDMHPVERRLHLRKAVCELGEAYDALALGNAAAAAQRASRAAAHLEAYRCEPGKEIR